MIVRHVSLCDFRNYTKQVLDLSPGLNILVGANAQGKTNFLEALYFGAMGRSRRAGNDRELIRFGAKAAFVQLEVETGRELMETSGLAPSGNRIDVHIRREGPKGIAVNGLPLQRLGDLFGVLLVVMFSPEDLQLVKNGPAERRRFYDMELCQLSPVYYGDLQRYYRVMKQRNSLLKRLQKFRDEALLASLAPWDEQLADYGARIVAHRRRFTVRLDELASAIHGRVTGGLETLRVAYKPSVNEADFREKLARNLERDIYMGTTTIGIQKDDAVFYINDVDARQYGSQGQQRTASLSLKLAEIDLIREEKGETPVLLLDDVFSELDADRQRCLLESIQDVQTVLTCTGVEDMLAEVCGSAEDGVAVFHVSGGSIARV